MSQIQPCPFIYIRFMAAFALYGPLVARQVQSLKAKRTAGKLVVGLLGVGRFPQVAGTEKVTGGLMVAERALEKLCEKGQLSIRLQIPQQAGSAVPRGPLLPCDPSTCAGCKGPQHTSAAGSLRQVGGKVPQGQKGTPFHSTGTAGKAGRVFCSPAHRQVDA